MIICDDSWKPCDIEEPIPVVPVDWKKQYDMLAQEHMIVISRMYWLTKENKDLKDKIEHLEDTIEEMRFDMDYLKDGYVGD